MTIQINTSNASPFLPQDWLDSRRVFYRLGPPAPGL